MRTHRISVKQYNEEAEKSYLYKLNRVNELARKHLGVVKDRTKTRYDTNANNVGFQQGDLVLLHDLQKRKVNQKFGLSHQKESKR